MTEPTATQTQPATTAQPAAPAPATPAAATPPAAPKHGAPQTQRNATVVESKTYGTGGRAARAALQSAADAARGGQQAPTAPAATAPAVTPAPAETPAEPPPGVAEPTESAEAAPETPADAPAADPPKVTESDITTRMGKLARAERKLAEERQAFAEERRQHGETLRRVQLIEQAAASAKQDPIGFLQRAFGVTRQQLADAFIGQRTGAAAAQTDTTGNDPVAMKLAELERQLQESQRTAAEQREAEKVQTYISGTLRPIVSDAQKYPYLNHEFRASAADEVYKSMAALWVNHRKTVDPRVAADTLEKHFREKYLGAPGVTGAPKPQAAASQKQQVGATASKPAPAQAAKPAAAPADTGPRRIKAPPKSYTSTVR